MPYGGGTVDESLVYMSVRRGMILFAGICTAMGLTLSAIFIKVRRLAAWKIGVAELEVRGLERGYRDSLQQMANCIVERCSMAEQLLAARNRVADSLLHVIEQSKDGEDNLSEGHDRLLGTVKSLFESLLAGADCNRVTKKILRLLSVGEGHIIHVSGKEVAIGGYCQRLSVMREAVVIVRVTGEFDTNGKMVCLAVEESLR